MSVRKRCNWCLDGGIMQEYHDSEWGISVHDDKKQFEFLMMEVMQCGLNWRLMLKKRDVFRQCFEDFNFDKVAEYGQDEISRELKKRGFKFLGSVTVYSHLQACGIINDHEGDCFMYEELIRNYPVVYKHK